jgi:hypothetical protein
MIYSNILLYFLKNPIMYELIEIYYFLIVLEYPNIFLSNIHY